MNRSLTSLFIEEVRMICLARNIDVKKEVRESEKFWHGEVSLTSIGSVELKLRRMAKGFFRKCVVFWLNIIKRNRRDGYIGSLCFRVPELNLFQSFRFCFIFLPKNRRHIIMAKNRKIFVVNGGEYLTEEKRGHEDERSLLLILTEAIILEYVKRVSKESVGGLKISFKVDEKRLDLIRSLCDNTT